MCSATCGSSLQTSATFLLVAFFKTVEHIDRLRNGNEVAESMSADGDLQHILNSIDKLHAGFKDMHTGDGALGRLALGRLAGTLFQLLLLGASPWPRGEPGWAEGDAVIDLVHTAVTSVILKADEATLRQFFRKAPSAPEALFGVCRAFALPLHCSFPSLRPCATHLILCNSPHTSLTPFLFPLLLSPRPG